VKYIKTYEQNNESDRFLEASRAGNLDVVKELLKRSDIDVNIQDNDGNTALIWVSFYGQFEITKELLKRSDIDVNIQDNDGNTALIWALYNGYLEIVIELLKMPNIDLNIKDKDGKDFFDYLKEDQKEKIIDEFPEQYQRYLMNKKIDKYNL
jgi:ankyrin repeat protein